MKYLGRLLLAFSLIVVVGCSKDDNTSNEPQEQEFQVTGNWRLLSYSYFGSRTDFIEDDVIQSQFVGFGYDMDMNLVLSDNPNSYTYVGSYFVDHVVTTQEGNELFYYGYFEKDDVGTWNTSSNSISIVVEGETNQGTITELTANTLEYKIVSSSSETNYDGVTTNITRTDTYNFVRQ